MAEAEMVDIENGSIGDGVQHAMAAIEQEAAAAMAVVDEGQEGVVAARTAEDLEADHGSERPMRQSRHLPVSIS